MNIALVPVATTKATPGVELQPADNHALVAMRHDILQHLKVEK
jgi:hypothetical protein